MIIKVCGMKDAENIRQVDKLPIDLMGFIFYPKSPRFLSEKPEFLPTKAKRVGVFVNEEWETIIKNKRLFGLDYIQLHGNESPEDCYKLQEKGIEVIKAFSVSSTEDIALTKKYDGSCNYFLFDTKTSGYGGSGKHFDWNILLDYQDTTPFLLSGGIDINDIEQLKHFTHPQLIGYDLNSRFESQPGIKRPEMIRFFIEQLSHSQNQ